MPTVLLLRPAAQASADVAVCQQLGWLPVVVSPMCLVAESAVLSTLPEAMQAANVVFWVSPGAVTVAAAVLPETASTIHVAVGDATARALRAQGVQQVLLPSDGHDSEAVLRLPLWRDAPKRVLVVRGVGGRDFLVDALRARGWVVQVAEVYRRVAQTIDWARLLPYLHSGSLNAVYVAASSMFEAWWGQIPPSLRDSWQSLLYLTHHERVAAVLRHHGLNVKVVDTLAQGLAHLNSTGSLTP